MDQSSVIKTISDLLAEIIDEDDLALHGDTTADDVEDWDSLAHVKLILAIESHYGFRFEVSEIAQPDNVAELADLIIKNVTKLHGNAA